MKTKKLILLIIAISMIVTCMTQMVSAETKTSSNLYPVSSNGIFSYVDINGNEVRFTSFVYADDFIGGVAKVMDKSGRSAVYIDTNFIIVNNAVKVYPQGKYREYKGGKVVDIYSKAKKYSLTNKDKKLVKVTEYAIGDGFIIKESLAGGTPKVQLFKNGKLFFTLDKKEISIIAKYDDVKMIRIQYSDLSDAKKIKTTYIDYNGNLMWTKPTETPIKVLLNETQLKLNQAPVIRNNVVMMPVEETLKSLGYTTKGDNNSMITATDKKNTIVVIPKTSSFTVNNKAVKLESLGRNVNGVFYLPAKTLIEQAGAKYSWDAKTNTVKIAALKTPNGAIIVNNLKLKDKPYFYVGVDYGDDFEARAIEAGDAIITAINELAGKDLTDDQRAGIKVAILASTDVITLPFNITVNGKVFKMSTFEKNKGSIENTCDINVIIEPLN